MNLKGDFVILGDIIKCANINFFGLKKALQNNMVSIGN